VEQWYRVAETRYSARTVVAKVFAGGGEPEPLVDLADPPTPTVTIDGNERRPLRTLGYWLPRYDASRAGMVYVTPSDEYQVVQYASSGEPQWALRVAWPRPPVSEAEIDAAFNEIRESRPETSRREIHSRGHHPALAAIAVDGHERLWVFPCVRNVLEQEWRPVDVYSKDGDLLVTGIIPVRRRVTITGEYEEAVRWQDASGDFVYRVEADPETEEHRVIRYRLVGLPEHEEGQ